MPFDPEKHHRRSIRLPGYDYSQPGAYFVTIVTHDRVARFGRIEHGKVEHSAAGLMAQFWWTELEKHFHNIAIDTFVVMPNHLHGILVLDGEGGHTGPPLPAIIRWFKTMTTNAYIRKVRDKGWPAFQRRLWQRGYYEYISRDERDLEDIREYIINNPLRWNEDLENPLVSA